MKTTSARWDAAILVCRKCSKKMGGGFGEKGKTPLAKALHARAGGGKGRKASLGVVEIGCQKVCPKNAVVAINGARPKDWLIVPKGAALDEVVERLGLEIQARL
jgi:predicted metal-binding protein